jgi:hypothetical protein
MRSEDFISLSVTTGQNLPRSARGYFVAIMLSVLERAQFPEHLVADFVAGLGISKLSPDEALSGECLQAVRDGDTATTLWIIRELLESAALDDAFAAVEGAQSCIEYLCAAEATAPHVIPVDISRSTH